MRSTLLQIAALLIRLQPAEIRRRYGDEILGVIEERMGENLPVAAWCTELSDLFLSAATARKRFFGYLLIGSATAHACYAAWIYPFAIMGFAAVLLTLVLLLSGVAMLISSDADRLLSA